MIIVKVETENNAFSDGNKPFELARLFAKASEYYENGIYNFSLMDINGNKVFTSKEEA